MSRTYKDRPYDIIVYDRDAYPATPRHTYHWHAFFGKHRTRTRAVRDENGSFVYRDAEQTYWAFDWSGSLPRYYPETRIVSQRVFEEVPAGVYADYCTASINPRDLPEGIIAPCRTHLSRVRQGKASTRAESRAWHNGDRRFVRDTLRGYATEYRANGDVMDEDNLETRHRHGASWWY